MGRVSAHNVRVSQTLPNDIEYRDDRELPRDQVVALFRACGLRQAERPEELLAALAGSHAVVTAWCGERLVGMGSAVSDGALVVYYPYLVVHPDYQRRGIGRQIMSRLAERYAGFDQQVLLADDCAVGFYAKCGFSRPGPVRAMWHRTGGEATLPAAPGERVFSTRQKWALALWGLQVFVTLIAAAAACVDVESIIGTGPALTVAGVALALVARPARSWWVLGLSLSAPAVCVLCAALIVTRDWGPADAQVPISVIAAIYAVLAAPLAVMALRSILAWQSERRPFVWRYSLKSLLVLVTVVCLLAAGVRALATGTWLLEGYNAFVAFMVAAAALAGLALVLFIQGRRR